MLDEFCALVLTYENKEIELLHQPALLLASCLVTEYQNWHFVSISMTFHTTRVWSYKPFTLVPKDCFSESMAAAHSVKGQKGQGVTGDCGDDMLLHQADAFRQKQKVVRTCERVQALH